MQNTTPLEHLRDIMRKLRQPETGCAWDLAQNFKTIAPYAIEEAYEILDAVERDDMTAFKQELGDLLLQVVFQSQIAEEAGIFNFDEVATAIADKMVTRHPHVFGDAATRSVDEQLSQWETQKSAERAKGGEVSALDGVAASLPALMRAEKLQKRAARVGFEWTSTADVFLKLDEEINELKIELAAATPDYTKTQDELGDVLFVAVNLCRVLKCDAEETLRKGNQKFERRFKAMETLTGAAGQNFNDQSLADRITLWQRVKELEKVN